jgi:squalene cyclase
MVAGMHALVQAGPGTAANVRPVVEMIVAHQGPDGLWLNTDTFAMLEALQATGLDPARTAARRTLSTLVERQRVDGAFGVMAQQERALIVLRAILWANPEL